MADQPKKPRNIKDLKARLGRTIAPNQQQGQDAATPPSNVGGGQQPSSGGGVVPPPGAGGGPPPPGIPGGQGPGGVAPPPFMQKKQQQQQQSSDPFSAGGAGAAQEAKPQEVRLVVDEKPVDDAEVGRKARFRTLMLVGVGIIVGVAVGAGVGSTTAENSTYNAAVRDGKAIYKKVREASGKVEEANQLVDRAVKKAKGGPGSDPTVDFEALEQLRAMEKPFDAGDFARKRYRAFDPGTVDSLFDYYNKVNLLWEKFQSLAARSLPEQRQKLLKQAAQAAGELTSTQTGCVPVVEEEQPMKCGLVYVHKPTEETEEGKVLVSTTLQGRTFPKTPYQGQEDLLETPDDYVILTNTEKSGGVLGQSAGLFAEYRRDLFEINSLMDETMKVQGKLEQGLGGVAALEERFAF